MSRRHISQSEAHSLEKRVRELESILENQRSRWGKSYPGGTHLGWIKRERDWFAGQLEAANALQHAIVVIPNDNGQIDFYALPHPQVPV